MKKSASGTTFRLKYRSYGYTGVFCELKLLLMREPRKFRKRGSNFDIVFLVDEGREDPNTTISGPLSARQRNTIKWRVTGVSMMAQH